MRKPITWILGTCFLLLFATSAQAGTRTITVESQEYSVPLNCKITRESGSITPLAKLRGIMNADQGMVPDSDVDFVRFEAVKKPGGWAMVKITLLDEIPE